MKVVWRASQLLFGIVLVLASAYIFLGPAAMLFAPSKTQILNPEDIHPNGGNSYVARSTLRSKFGVFEIRVDSNIDAYASTVGVFEDGKKLGPSHSQHGDINKLGEGRYSYWGNAEERFIIFSASDNSDPRTNNRKYTISAQPQFSLLTFVTVVLPLSIVILQRVFSPWLLGSTVTLAASALIAWVWLFFGHITLVPDSTTYTEWRPLVPLGYPLFLSGIKTLFSSLAGVSAIQITLTVAASLFLALSVAKITKHQAAGFAALLVLLCYLPMFSMAGLLLSEGLFIPLLLANVGAAIYLIAEPKIRYAILLALTAALIMFVRPAGYFAPLGVVFLAIALASRFRWMVKWAIAPMVAFALATLLINVAVRGNASPSQVGRNLFPHIAFLFEPGWVTGPDGEFAIIIDEALTPHRAGYQNSTSLVGRFLYSMNDFNDRLTATDIALRAKLETTGPFDSEAMFRKLESIYIRLFITTIYHKPIDYLLLVREQILGAWQISILTEHGPFSANYILGAAENYEQGAKVIKAWKLPLREEALRPNPAALDGFPGRFVSFFESLYQRSRSQRWLIYTIGAITLLAVPVGVFARRRSRHWLALGYCGVMIHGSMLLTAAVTVFIPRYALAVDPVILVADVIIVDGLLSWGLARMRQLGKILADFLRAISFRNPRIVGDR